MNILIKTINNGAIKIQANAFYVNGENMFFIDDQRNTIAIVPCSQIVCVAREDAVVIES